MRRFYVMVLSASLLLSGCSFFNQQDEAPLNDVAGSDELIGDVLDPYYNPYNYTTVTDGEYVFYCDAAGIFRWSVTSGETQLIVSEERVRGIVLHNSYVYYIISWDSAVYRINKDGKDRIALETSFGNKRILLNTIHCFQDRLYIDCTVNIGEKSDGIINRILITDINDDENELILGEGPVIPTSRGASYIIENYTTGWEIASHAIYCVYPDGHRRFIADGILSNPNYLITDNYIFYIKEDPQTSQSIVWRCNLDGENQTILVGGHTIGILMNYDDEWVYGYMQNKALCRIHQASGHIEEYPAWPHYASNPCISIVGSYMYGFEDGYYYGGRVIRMHVDGGDIEYAPF
ncbi:MAG: hypothetical protein FWF88_09155 [Peptococcaceae bacterium]|nr:hypothetical protein [Peptococcaceae bacterium]